MSENEAEKGEEENKGGEGRGRKQRRCASSTLHLNMSKDKRRLVVLFLFQARVDKKGEKKKRRKKGRKGQAPGYSRRRDSRPTSQNEKIDERRSGIYKQIVPRIIPLQQHRINGNRHHVVEMKLQLRALKLPTFSLFF